MATILRANGEMEDLPGPLSLEQMQKAVGGYIEFVTLRIVGRERHIMIVNEEGLLKDLPVNPQATALYVEATRGAAVTPIVGDVILATLRNPGEDNESIT